MAECLGSITIYTKDRQSNSLELQKVLSDNAHLIIARLGVNPQRKCIANCSGLISVIVEGEEKEIAILEKSLKKLKKVTITKSILK